MRIFADPVAACGLTLLLLVAADAVAASAPVFFTDFAAVLSSVDDDDHNDAVQSGYTREPLEIVVEED